MISLSVISSSFYHTQPLPDKILATISFLQRTEFVLYMDLLLTRACSHVPMSVTLHSYNGQLQIYLHRLKGTRTHYKEHSPLGSCQDATTTAAHQQPFLRQSLAWYYI